MKHRPDKMSDDFMRALKEPLPDDFGEALYAQLQSQDHTPESDAPPPQKNGFSLPRYGWTIAAACVMTLLFGSFLLVARVPELGTLSTPLQPLTYDSAQPITAANVAQLERFDTIGNGQARSIALSPDGNTLAVSTSQGIYLHDANDLQAEPRWLTDAVSLYHLHYTANESGAYLYGVNSATDRAGFEFTRINVADGRITSLDYLETVLTSSLSLAVDQTGTRAVLGACEQTQGRWTNYGMACDAGNATLRVYDLTTPTLLDTLDTGAGMVNAAMPDNGAFFVYLQDMETVMRYDMASQTSQALFTFDRFSSKPSRLSVSPQGTYLALSPYRGSPIWRMADLQQAADDATETPTMPTARHMLRVLEDSYQLTFNPQETAILDTYDTYLISAELSDDEHEMTLTNTRNIYRLAFTPPGDHFFILTQVGLIQRWDWQTLQPVATLERYISPEGTGTINTTNTGDEFVVSSYDRRNTLSRVVSATPLQPTSELLQAEPDTYYASTYANISPDGRFVVWLQQGAYQTNARMMLRDRHTGEIFPIRIEYSLDSFEVVSFDEHNNLYLILNGWLYLYSAELLSEYDASDDELPDPMVIRLDGYRADWARIPNSVIHPTGQYIITTVCKSVSAMYCGESTLMVWDTATGDLLAEETIAGNVAYYPQKPPAFSPTGEYFAAAYCAFSHDVTKPSDAYDCEANRIGIWSLQALLNGDEETIRTTIDTDALPGRATFSPLAAEDGSLLLAFSQWKRETGTYHSHLRVELHHISATGETTLLRKWDDSGYPSFSADGDTLLFVQSDGTVEAWGVAP